MTGVDHEVLELVALVHKQVVDAHHAEVHHIIGTLLDAVGLSLIHIYTVGGAMSGYCSTGSVNSEMIPATNIMIETETAIAGRRCV